MLKILLSGLLIFFPASAAAQKVTRPTPPTTDYLRLVRRYADALIAQGRDRYGKEHSPLFATTLDRRTLSLFAGPELERIKALERSAWGIRSHDRMVEGANPMHDLNLYQVLYALTRATGEARYAAEADRTLKWFFDHCQSEQTQLLAWGEHIGWDFHTETIIAKVEGTMHEFFRPWVLWERSYALAPQASARFARGLWEHQIADHATGNFSRHARYDRHGPAKNSQYPRHGGFYIAAWVEAYARTREPVFLQASETLLNHFESRRSPVSGAIPMEDEARSAGKLLTPPNNLSLAIDLWASAAKLPAPAAAPLAERMRRAATQIDDVFLKVAHDLSPGGKGFVKAAHADTLAPGELRAEYINSPYFQASNIYTERWATGYSGKTDAELANHCLLRYRQVKREGYRRLGLDAARRYLDSAPDAAYPIYPGTVGQVIWLMLAAHELTGEAQYLRRAEYFAREAVRLFFDDQSPLPKASSSHEHYEAITRADTLAMALLKLWGTQQRPALKLDLVFTDR